MTIDVTLLGTGNPLPDPSRAGSAVLVRVAGRSYLVDAGRGVCQRLAAAGSGPAALTAVLLTHLHSDHITDLNDVVTTRWVTSLAPDPLPVVGPARTGEAVAGILAMLGPDIGYRIAHHDDLTEGPQVRVEEHTGGVVVDDPDAGLRIVAAPTDHRPVEPTLGYRFDHDGRSVVLGGDGVPCEGLDQLCRGADVYVQTVLRDDLVRQVPLQRFLDTIDYHSTVRQAAETAQRNGVGTLVMTHQVPTPLPGSAQEWVAIAAEVFDGEIVFGEDLTRVSA